MQAAIPAKRPEGSASRDPGTRVRAVALDPRLKAEGNDKRWWRRWCDRCNRCAHTLGPALGESTSLHAVADAALVAAPHVAVARERPEREVGAVAVVLQIENPREAVAGDRKSTRLNSSH